MPKSDTWRTVGFEADMSSAMVSPTIVQVAGATPKVWPSATTGTDVSAIGRKSILLVIQGVRTAGETTITVTESATTNGSYTAATTAGNLLIMTATGVRLVTVKVNRAKPFIRVTATGDGAPADWVLSATFLYV